MKADDNIAKYLDKLKSELKGVEEKLKDTAHQSAAQLTVLRRRKKQLATEIKNYSQKPQYNETNIPLHFHPTRAVYSHDGKHGLRF